jgi:hypothetical protein
MCAAYSALIEQVRDLAVVIEALGNDVARPAGQTLARWEVLAAVESESAPVVAIVRTIGHTRQSVQRIDNLLVDDGLVAIDQTRRQFGQQTLETRKRPRERAFLRGERRDSNPRPPGPQPLRP